MGILAHRPPTDRPPLPRPHRYGRDFGKQFLLQDVVDSAPRIRVRRAQDRALDQLADLVVLNERLSQTVADVDATAARQRIEYLKRRRRNWEMVYQYVTTEDALCTLEAIEEANVKVETALSEESRERVGVGALKRQLQDLQAEVASAHSRLHATQSRVESNLQRITELKEEAARLGQMDASEAAAAVAGARRKATATASRKAALKQQRGLHSSLDLESELKNQ